MSAHLPNHTENTIQHYNVIIIMIMW